MGLTVTEKLIQSHLVSGEMQPGEEIQLRIDQTLTQDATGTMVMLELEAMGLARARTEVSVQYVDHNLIQQDNKNPDDHLFLLSACQRFGLWYSRPGNGVSHPVHMERFGVPGKSMLGSDSHTCAAGSLGMLAIGAGGIEVALAISGEPVYVKMPQLFGVRLTGRLPDWVSAKDVILEMLRRHGVGGGVGRIIEYYGPGVKALSAMDRHVIANMGAELGATTSVFPSDERTREFMQSQGRGAAWLQLQSDAGAAYIVNDEIDLGQLEPMIAMPSSPGNVKYVKEVAGEPIYQAYIGSSANPGYRDFAIAAEITMGRQAHQSVSYDINPSSRQILQNLVRDGHLASLIASGARIHQAGCNGCIGMGQAPATGLLSLRTVPRNFPGRSGTREDKVCLVSPETAAASALTGRITDPRTLSMPYPHVAEPEHPLLNTEMLQAPLPVEDALRVELVKGPNIAALPPFEAVADELELTLLLKVGDNISTDEILPAGARVLPLRSNIPKIAEFAFEVVDPAYHARALELSRQGISHAIAAGRNYGQGSSREHAVLAPRYLGLRLVLAQSFARIHWQNLVDFGVLPLCFSDPADYDRLEPGVTLSISGLRHQMQSGREVLIGLSGGYLRATHDLSDRQLALLLAGGLINERRQKS